MMGLRLTEPASFNTLSFCGKLYLIAKLVMDYKMQKYYFFQTHWHCCDWRREVRSGNPSQDTQDPFVRGVLDLFLILQNSTINGSTQLSEEILKNNCKITN